MHLTGAPADDFMLRTLAEAVRGAGVASLCVIKVGDRFNAWAHANPAPFELVDGDDNLLWMEGVGNVGTAFL